MSRMPKMLSVAALAGLALTFSVPAHADHDQWRNDNGARWWGYHDRWPGYQHGYPRSDGWSGNRFFYRQGPRFYGERPYNERDPHRWYGYQDRDPWPRRDWRGNNWSDDWRYH